MEKVLIGLSGGVDSAVAALLLKKKGYEVIAAFMKNFSATKNKLTGECNYLDDLRDARKIAAILNIKLIVLDFEKEYKKHVIDPMFKQYSQGFTPNPDSLCNKIIKFPLLWKKARELGAEFVVTGHYVRIKDGKLFRGKDEDKDQSYFLYDLKAADLKHLMFPIGDYTKDQVRAIAKKNKFPNWDKHGTRGICFVGKVNMKSFLGQKIKKKEGLIKTSKGEIVGKHPGIAYFTIGERIGNKYGLKVNDEYRNKVQGKLYVADKIKNKNVLIVAPENDKALYKNRFFIIKSTWVNEKVTGKIKVRIRHLGELMPATLKMGKGKLTCSLKRPVRGIADGQSAVFYLGSRVLGGGEIRF